ncbi:MAG: hypothetical protein IJZ39_07025 [Oscillospiraceae bacterium]|nr:hypothetical protein [Oscillospiraceae bacterium]
MDELKPNSDRYREGLSETPATQKRVTKVVSGNTQVRSSNTLVKLTDIFLAGDMAMVKDHLFREHFVPKFKNFLYEGVIAAARLLVYGEAGRVDTKATPGSKIEYRSYYDNNTKPVTAPAASVSKNVYDYGYIMFEDKADAVEALVQMRDILERYPTVSVADLKEIAKITPASTDYNYGWIDLSSADVVYRPLDNRYVIKLPKALPLD